MKKTSLKTAGFNTCVSLFFLFLLGTSCSSVSNKKQQNENEVALPVYKVDTGTVVLTKNFLGTVEWKNNVEVRPQVEG